MEEQPLLTLKLTIERKFKKEKNKKQYLQAHAILVAQKATILSKNLPSSNSYKVKNKKTT